MEIGKTVQNLIKSMDPQVKLIAVTKTIEVNKINEAIKAGITCIAENRIQEAMDKFPKLLQCERHFIGHLQSNKVLKAVELFDCIESVDSLKIAGEIDKRAREKDKIMQVFIEVNIGREEQKSGILPDNVGDFYNKVIKLQNIKVNGIMCIPPYLEVELCRPYFKEMKKIQESLGVRWLSMGMSNDYLVAIKEGSNMIRIGRGIFGERTSV